MLEELVHSNSLDNVKYEIRGSLAKRAHELERAGYDIVSLNIGNPGLFGFRVPDTMRVAIVENLTNSDAYCHQKGIFPAREAVVMRWQNNGIKDVSSDDVFMGNGVSELIVMCMKGLLNNNDEVLVPAPDYPLWTAAVEMHGGKAVHYKCKVENGFIPKIEDIEKSITDKTRAIVIINPNNPTGAVYPETFLREVAELAEKNNLVIFSDEIYDEILYEDAAFSPIAKFVKNTLCVTFGGLSKIYRACGFRVGWMSLSGEKSNAEKYIESLELLASLRLCSNVPGQWAVQTAIGGYQSIFDLTAEGGRLYESRKIVLEAVEKSEYLKLSAPMGAMYAFLEVDKEKLPDFNDKKFALDLLEQKHILLAPGTSFNIKEDNFMRITLLPEARVLKKVFKDMEEILSSSE